MKKFWIEHCKNGRTHVWIGKIKVWSYGPRAVKPFANPKLGVSYSVWDGEELLEQSIKQIRSVVDYVNVVWQKLSWFGKSCDANLEEKLLKLKEKGLIDELIFFDPDLSLNPSCNELNKRNIGLDAARKAGCTHFITMDTDEFYDTAQFKNAWADIVKYNLSHTVCNIVSYITPTLRYRDYENFFVLFICRIDHGEKFTFAAFRDSVPCLLDPTRQIKLRSNSRFCFLGNIVMHHMTHVRKDIIKKITNSSANQTIENKKTLQTRYLLEGADIKAKLESGDIIKVDNKFRIEI